MESKPFLELEGITKRFGGVTALNDVSFSCEQHSIHAILGENGAGKSTLIKIISGVLQADSGGMKLADTKISFSSPTEAFESGIVSVFQELSLMPDLSVADNICITTPPRQWGLIDNRAQIMQAEELLARVGCEDINPRARCRDLPLSRRQLVEIAKALGRNPKLLILDEATSAITAADVEKVFEILQALRDEGLSMLYITHRLQEAEMLCDTCSVFRNGERISTFPQGSQTPDEIVEMMIGRSISQVYPDKPKWETTPNTILEVEDLNWDNQLHDLSFDIGKGEIVGLGGLDGQGQREVLLSLFGALRGLSMTLKIEGRKVSIRSPAEAKNKVHGLAMIPEDRKTEGLLLPMSIRENISLGALDQVSRLFVIDRDKEKMRVKDMVEQLRIGVGSADEPAGSLSGGNQQKVVIAKWLLSGARCLLLMDPTRGIDVGTKQELYHLLRNFADQGTSVLFYSTDYEELIGMCDRVIILYEGRIVRELKGEEINEHNIITASLNLKPEEKNPYDDTAYDLIKKRIIDFTYPPGYKISSSKLKEELNIGHSRVQIALFRLSGEGLVELSSNGETSVKGVSLDDISEIYDTRIILETGAAKEIIEQLSDAQLDELEILYNQTLEEDAKFDYQLFMERENEFHLAIIRYTNNKKLLNVYKQLNAHMQEVRFRYRNRDVERFPRTNQEHESILNGFKERNLEKVVAAIEDHLQSGKRAFLSLVAQHNENDRIT
jgi:ribose transport system ATP-binding protein